MALPNFTYEICDGCISIGISGLMILTCERLLTFINKGKLYYIASLDSTYSFSVSDLTKLRCSKFIL